MFSKTMALLSGIKPGTYCPDDVVCYDPAEIDALGGFLKRLVYGPSAIRRRLQQHFGVTVTRADFYSEIPTVAELERSFEQPSLLQLDTVFPGPDVMRAELARLMAVSHEFDPPIKSDRPGEFCWAGGQFSLSDAMAYYTMIRTRQPRTIVEIGSGWSTLVARLACARNGFGRIVCIEPYPNPQLSEMTGIELMRVRVQEIETAFFNATLHDGDLLFIDSTHTVKHDSDCLHIYLRILPAIAAAITVHAHDISLPDPLGIGTMREQQIFWNEQYLLYAYLLGNRRTRVVYGSRYHKQRNPALLDRFMHGRYGSGGGSFWFEHARAEPAAPAAA